MQLTYKPTSKAILLLQMQIST